MSNKLTRKQFCEYMGMPYDDKNRPKIHNWIKRGNVVSDDGYIDVDDEHNVAWVQKHRIDVKVSNLIREKKERKKHKPRAEKDKGAPFPEPLSKDDDFEKQDTPTTPGGKSKYDLDLEKKQLDIEKVGYETTILKIRSAKMRGELVPIDLIKNLFSQHSHFLITEFKNAVDNMLTLVGKKKELSLREVAELKGEVVALINHAVDKAIEESKKNLGNIVNDFSQTRDRGQHD